MRTWDRCGLAVAWWCDSEAVSNAIKADSLRSPKGVSKGEASFPDRVPNMVSLETAPFETAPAAPLRDAVREFLIERKTRRSEAGDL